MNRIIDLLEGAFFIMLLASLPIVIFGTVIVCTLCTYQDPLVVRTVTVTENNINKTYHTYTCYFRNDGKSIEFRDIDTNKTIRTTNPYKVEY